MFKQFSTLEALYQEIDRDKNFANAGEAEANRYPIRFVLFETFSDFYQFVQKCSTKGLQVIEIEKWLDAQHADTLPTYSSLSSCISDYVDCSDGQDAVLIPFSELARFYSNRDVRALVKTIRLKEANNQSQKRHLRIYVPLIGMQGRLAEFRGDHDVHMWEYRTTEPDKGYRLILCQEHFQNKRWDGYSHCDTFREWIELWKKGAKVHSDIICSSRNIFSLSANAKPDNAFEYTHCHNAFEFLRDGLRLIPDTISYKPSDLEHWERLTTEINDVKGFNLENYVLSQFNVIRIDESKFMQFWFDRKDPFSRWLLKIYYLMKYCEGKYLCRVLQLCDTTYTSELFENLVLLIFNQEFSFADIKERRELISSARAYGVTIKEQTEEQLKIKLTNIAENPECGYSVALKYMTDLTDTEKGLLVTWFGKGKITRVDVQSLLPDLYEYTAPLHCEEFTGLPWLNDYFDEYRTSKIADLPSLKLIDSLKTRNGSPAAFETWRNEFRTVKTILTSRDDIEVYYWIDGLGVDWIPFIRKIIEEYQSDGVYLNEVYVGIAQLPTVTSINKAELESISHGNLRKVGDLDEYAHTRKQYPEYICHEFELVRHAVIDALSQYNGRKIAFVSDHGISYMAQHGGAHSLSKAVGHHAGRCAAWETMPIPHDKKYVIVPGEKIISSLTHDSLTDKTPYGVGAHGGATPEEVLVPILIVSGQQNPSNYEAVLLEHNVGVNNPVVKYNIKGIRPNTMTTPEIEYNGIKYSLHRKEDNLYESEPLQLIEDIDKITLKIGSYMRKDSISVKTGVSEDDILGDL